jgi:hypothetical protein
MKEFPFLRQSTEGVLLDLHVQPKAGKNEIYEHKCQLER